MSLPGKLVEFLTSNHAPFEVRHHPIAYTAQEIAAIVGVPGRQLAKVAVVRCDGRFLLAVLPADRRIDFQKLGAIVGGTARLASEIEIRNLFPDCAVGAMPPFGTLYGLETYVDGELEDRRPLRPGRTGRERPWRQRPAALQTDTHAESIVFEAGTHSDAIKMRWSDYLRLAEPVIAEFSTKIA